MPSRFLFVSGGLHNTAFKSSSRAFSSPMMKVGPLIQSAKSFGSCFRFILAFFTQAVPRRTEFLKSKAFVDRWRLDQLYPKEQTNRPIARCGAPQSSSRWCSECPRAVGPVQVTATIEEEKGIISPSRGDRNRTVRYFSHEG
jgi:hypothetical protein